MYTFLLSSAVEAGASVGDKIDPIFRGFDMWVYRIFGAIQNGFFTQIAKIFTSIGDENFVIPVAVLGLILCLFRKTRKYGFALVIAIAVGTLVTNVVVKPAFLRIRPYNTLQTTEYWAEYSAWYKAAGAFSESDYSFPSGHTTAAFEMAIAMFLCFRNTAKEKIKAGEKTAMGKAAIILPIIALFTMCSRIYLMVHYPTDVIAGLVVGTCAGIVGYLCSKLICRLFEKSPLDKIDLEKLFKKGITPKAASACICIILVGFFCLSYVPALFEGGDKEVRCAYSQEYGGEYDCYNAARDVDDKKRPAFDADGDGDLDQFCKIHWDKLHEEDNAA